MTTSRLAQQRVLQQLTRHPTFRQLHQTTRPSFRTRPNSTYSAFQKTLVRATRNISTWYTAFARSQRRIPNFRSAFRRQASSTAETENPSLSQRLKKLSREYGWSALGVYLALSAADFPFCFLAVRLVGADTIGHYEHVVVHWFKDLVSWPVSEEAGDRVEDGAKHAVEKVQTTVEEATGREKKVLEMDEAYEVTDHGYKDAEKANSGANASIWTQLALAYAIHKSFIFIRVPLTAAVTPKIVKTLRSWGWNIGKMPKKAVAGSGGKIGVNTKGTGVKSD